MRMELNWEIFRGEVGDRQWGLRKGVVQRDRT